jgi:prepilin-type N-terminal cleavage/methylation domain-containing protein
MSNRISHRKDAGFTMLEMAMAAAILAVTIGGFYATFGGSNDYAVRARLRNSAKVVLGAALNEALGTRWTKVPGAPKVLQVTTGWEDYDIGALPGFPTVNNLNIGITPALGSGDMSLFTDPAQNAVVTGHLRRNVQIHPSYTASGSVVTVTFEFTYTYKGVTSQPMYAYTVVTRLD